MTPRDNCPVCGDIVDTFSTDPLEESCINPQCDYYRAKGRDNKWEDREP